MKVVDVAVVGVAFHLDINTTKNYSNLEMLECVIMLLYFRGKMVLDGVVVVAVDDSVTDYWFASSKYCCCYCCCWVIRLADDGVHNSNANAVKLCRVNNV